MFKYLSKVGPGPTIAAAFIGPGTVTVCSLAGAQFGAALLWALLFSIFATTILQETAARLGLVTRAGLASNIKNSIEHKGLRWSIIALVLTAIVVGAIAYESGNIRGGSLGLVALFEAETSEQASVITTFSILSIAFLAGCLLWSGRYAVLQNALLALVVLMSIAFVSTAMFVVEDWWTVLRGLFIPSLPQGSLVLVVALIGTTIVPYNLFLHSDLVRQKWSGPQNLRDARRDAVWSVVLGGVISAAIVLCASAVPNNQMNSAGDLAAGLTPMFGDLARVMMALGLFAAGLTSAITAPIAASFVLQGVFDWQGDLKSTPQRVTCLTVLLIGTLVATLQINAVELIKVAQFANGLVLPFAVVFLWYAANRSKLLGEFVNSRAQNVATLLIFLLVSGLGLRAVFRVFA